MALRAVYGGLRLLQEEAGTQVLFTFEVDNMVLYNLRTVTARMRARVS